MDIGRYILEGHKAVRCDSPMQFAQWLASTDRTVRKTSVGMTTVSTVFLGIDHNWEFGGAPVLFETMVFGNEKFYDEQERYETWEEAEAGHEVMCKKVFGDKQ